MSNCELCGEPMPAGEEMFKFHGYSGQCPKPPKPAIEKPKPNTYWLIESIGPGYIGARKMGGYDFYWTADHNAAIRFFSREQADAVMMTIRRLCPDLFPDVFPKPPQPVEHAWLS